MPMDRFDPSRYPEIDNAPLKPGFYEAKITNIAMQDTRAGDGNMLVVDLQVHGRRIRDWILRNHPSEKAVEIANQRLASLCRAAGVVALTDTDQLVGAAVEVGLAVDGDFNKVRNYSRIGRSTTPKNDIVDDDLPF